MNVELRVVVHSNDTRDTAAERLEDLVRAVLTTALGEQVYVERAKVSR